jgi:hypothetical protein
MHALSRRNVLCGLALIGAGSTLTSAPPLQAADRTALAIHGYDTVAYFTHGSAQRGLPEFEYVWDEFRYLFLSAEHRELFKADPVRYAPQFPNRCANAMARGELIEADPKNWLISGGKLYMFGKSTGPGLFQENLTENIDKANRNHSLMRSR